MPPVTKADQSTFRKDVDFVAKDDDQQVATGIVMVPNAVDLQGDWEQPETIREFAEQFGNLYEAGEADGGIMHAAWPSEWMELESNRVLDEAEEIGGVEAPAGAWVQDWAFNKDELWNLVADGVLEGYSIGAVDVDWRGPMAQDELPEEVTVPDRVDEDEPVWELVSALIREVSAVDIPAVPDAMILDTKADAEKRLADHLGNRDGFVEEALERGHSEDEAERLWDVLNDAADVEGAGEPGKQSMFARAGKAFLSALSGSDDDGKESEAPDREKEGRTLSTTNQHSLMATIDASLDVLQDAGVDHGMTRFTDREDTAFDLTEHSARQWATSDEEDEGDDEEEEATASNATGGETPDDTDTTDMSDDNTDDPMADAPEWAKALNDRIDDLESEKDAGDGSDDPLDDAPEWAKGLADRVDEIEEKALDDGDEEDKPEWAKELEARIDTISQQSGVSTQLEAGAETEETDDSGLEGLGKALS